MFPPLLISPFKIHSITFKIRLKHHRNPTTNRKSAATKKHRVLPLHSQTPKSNVTIGMRLKKNPISDEFKLCHNHRSQEMTSEYLLTALADGMAFPMDCFPTTNHSSPHHPYNLQSQHKNDNETYEIVSNIQTNNKCCETQTFSSYPSSLW